MTQLALHSGHVRNSVTRGKWDPVGRWKPKHRLKQYGREAAALSLNLEEHTADPFLLLLYFTLQKCFKLILDIWNQLNVGGSRNTGFIVPQHLSSQLHCPHNTGVQSMIKWPQKSDRQGCGVHFSSLMQWCQGVGTLHLTPLFPPLPPNSGFQLTVKNSNTRRQASCCSCWFAFKITRVPLRSLLLWKQGETQDKFLKKPFSTFIDPSFSVIWQAMQGNMFQCLTCT